MSTTRRDLGLSKTTNADGSTVPSTAFAKVGKPAPPSNTLSSSDMNYAKVRALTVRLNKVRLSLDGSTQVREDVREGLDYIFAESQGDRRIVRDEANEYAAQLVEAKDPEARELGQRMLDALDPEVEDEPRPTWMWDEPSDGWEAGAERGRNLAEQWAKLPEGEARKALVHDMQGALENVQPYDACTSLGYVALWVLEKEDASDADKAAANELRKALAGPE